jgi:hypothetical protein
MQTTTMRLLLIRKLCDRIDGVDLSGVSVGDVLDLPLHQASLLIAEGWAEPLPAHLLPFRPVERRSSEESAA